MKTREIAKEITLGPKAQRDAIEEVVKAVEVVADVTGTNARDHLAAIIKKLEKTERDRALRVFDAFCDGNLPDDFDINSPDHDDQAAAGLIQQRRERLHTALADDLDYRSIGAFVEFVIEQNMRATQAANAHKRHAEHYAMKDEVFKWLDGNRAHFKSKNKTAMAITKQQPIAFVTALGWVGDWENVRSTGRPYGKPA